MNSAGSIRQRHEGALLALPNVIGVGTGRDEAGSEVIDVDVQRKVPRRELALAEAIPGVLDAAVDVNPIPVPSGPGRGWVTVYCAPAAGASRAGAG